MSRGGRGTTECNVLVVGIAGDQKEANISIPVKSLTTLKEQIGFNDQVNQFLAENSKEMTGKKALTSADFVVQVWNSTKNKFKTLKSDKDLIKYLTLFKTGVRLVIVHKHAPKPEKEKNATTRSSLANIYRKSLQQFSFGKSDKKGLAHSDSTTNVSVSEGNFNEVSRGDSDPSSDFAKAGRQRVDSEGKSSSSRNLAVGLKPRNSMSISLPTSPVQNSSPPTIRKFDASTPRGKNEAQQVLFGTQREKINTERGKEKEKKWKGPLFGQPISDVVDRQEQSATIPHIVTECVAWLRAKDARNEEGLFRISGSSLEIEELKKEYDKNGTVDLNKKDHNIHVISGLLKSYFREMPEPVIVYRYYSTALRVSQNPNPEIQKNNLKAIITKLPRAHRDVLLFMSSYLKEVSEMSEINKMHVGNIALIWGPNFLRNFAHLTTPMNQLTEADSVNGLIRLLIEENDFFLPLLNKALPEEEVQGSESEASLSRSPSRARSSTTNPSLSSSKSKDKSPATTYFAPRTTMVRAASKVEAEKRIGVLKKDLEIRKSQLDLRKRSINEKNDPELKFKALEARFPSECNVIAKFDYERAGVKVEEWEDLSLKRGQIFNFKGIKPDGNTLWILVQDPETNAFGVILPGQVIKKSASGVELNASFSSFHEESASNSAPVSQSLFVESNSPSQSEFTSSNSTSNSTYGDEKENPEGVSGSSLKAITATTSLDSFVPVDAQTEWEERWLLLEQDLLNCDEREAELEEVKRNAKEESDLALLAEEEKQLKTLRDGLLVKKKELEEEGKKWKENSKEKEGGSVSLSEFETPEKLLQSSGVSLSRSLNFDQ